MADDIKYLKLPYGDDQIQFDIGDPLYASHDSAYVGDVIGVNGVFVFYLNDNGDICVRFANCFRHAPAKTPKELLREYHYRCARIEKDDEIPEDTLDKHIDGLDAEYLEKLEEAFGVRYGSQQTEEEEHENQG